MKAAVGFNDQAAQIGVDPDLAADDTEIHVWIKHPHIEVILLVKSYPKTLSVAGGFRIKL
ncbi:MAG: hypothetical protein FJX89_00805 [Bacteroidetes bacterium]|nr:hypothetical protein [Bacteroidota bacterium]